MRWFKSLQFRIISICLSLSVLMAFLLSFAVYQNMKETYIQQDIHYSGLNMRMVMNNVDQYYSQIVNFLLWLSNNQEVNHFLTNKSEASAGAAGVAAFNAVQRQTQSMFLSTTFDKCIISSLDGDYLIVGRNNGDPSDYTIAAQADIPVSVGIQIGEIIVNPFRYGQGTTGLMLVCGIYKHGSAQLIGAAHLFMSAEMLNMQFRQYLGKDSGHLFFSTASGSYKIENQQLFSSPETDMELSSFHPYDSDNGIYTADSMYQGKSGQAVLVESSLTKWRLIRLLPEYTVYDISKDRMMILVLLGGVVFGAFILMSAIMSKVINDPVNRICNRVKLVAAGDFRRDLSVETEDELGYIGKGINSMSADIEKLILLYKEEEQKKKNYEFKVLQTQINPHFMYNTLNSIKWMASIQRATGITEMTSTLGHMLRLIAQANTEIISLEKELEFVKDYIVIQSYRYGDTFKMQYDIEDPSLLAANVIKFTIQPIVENAIFHGIEPRNSPGTILLRAFRREESLFVQVIDDGVGIPGEKLEKLNLFSQETAKESNNIGLYNIHHRIQLEYGEQYGLRIESEHGKGTKVTAHMPFLIAESVPAAGQAGGAVDV